MQIKSMIAALAISLASAGMVVAQDAAQTESHEVDTEVRQEHFEDAIFFREGVQDKVLSLIDPSDDLALGLIERGGVSTPGKAVMVEDEIFYIFDTCLARRCGEQSLRLVIAPSGDVFLKNEKGDRSHIRGTIEVTPKVQEIMDFWG